MEKDRGKKDQAIENRMRSKCSLCEKVKDERLKFSRHCSILRHPDTEWFLLSSDRSLYITLCLGLTTAFSTKG